MRLFRAHLKPSGTSRQRKYWRWLRRTGITWVDGVSEGVTQGRGSHQTRSRPLGVSHWGSLSSTWTWSSQCFHKCLGFRTKAVGGIQGGELASECMEPAAGQMAARPCSGLGTRDGLCPQCHAWCWSSPWGPSAGRKAGSSWIFDLSVMVCWGAFLFKHWTLYILNNSYIVLLL